MREWRAGIYRKLENDYIQWVESTGLAAYRRMHGHRGAIIAVRDLGGKRSEIVLLSWWTDKNVIEAFAGKVIERARYFPEDDQYLLTRPDTVQHYDSALPPTGEFP